MDKIPALLVDMIHTYYIHISYIVHSHYLPSFSTSIQIPVFLPSSNPETSSEGPNLGIVVIHQKLELFLGSPSFGHPSPGSTVIKLRVVFHTNYGFKEPSFEGVCIIEYLIYLCCNIDYKPKASASSHPAFPSLLILLRLIATHQWGSRPIVVLPKQEYSHSLHHA